jgi:hypothetical protein
MIQGSMITRAKKFLKNTTSNGSYWALDNFIKTPIVENKTMAPSIKLDAITGFDKPVLFKSSGIQLFPLYSG